VFDNQPCFGGKSKDFRHTRIRGLFGNKDIWFPPGKSTRNMNKLASKYRLQNKGSRTVIADHKMGDYNQGIADTIYAMIKEEAKAVLDWKAKPVYPYDPGCCSSDFNNNCKGFD